MKTEHALSKVQRSGSIDYMLRTAQQHHAQLSLMADQKANIMVAANTILVTVTLNSFDFEAPIWALLTLSLTSFLSLMAAILAVYPSTQKGLTNNNRQLKSGNLLFFGTFSGLDFDDYMSQMADVMQQDGAVYEAMLKDLYQLGVYIKKTKYRYIRMSYRIFFVGLSLSLLLFLGQFSLTFLGQV